MDRLEMVTYQDASVETYVYDDHGNRTAATDRSGDSQGWEYDTLHRLTRVIDAAGNQIDYAYDDAGNKIEQTVTPLGAAPLVTGYGYDALNRLRTVTDVNGLVTTYTYDENGNRASVTYPNGNETTYVYDANNRLTRQATENGASVLLADYQYTLDPSGHRLRIDEPGRQTTYTYDDSYKLLTEDIVDPVNGDHNAVYEYDDVGNRTYSTINGVQTLYTYDANDRLLQQGGEVFTYDDNGNTLTKTIDGIVSSYSYDAKNHLASGLLNDGGVITSTSYRYDVDGIRIGKTEGAESVDYLVDHNRDYAQVVRETDGVGASIDYLYGDDLIQQSLNAADERYFLYDGLGSTRLLTDELGVVTDRYDYEAFGSVIYREGVTENSYQFTGEQYDEGLDEYYLRARYYDQNTARFTQMDTWIGNNNDPLSLHKYLYAGSDPVNHVDPSGHFFSLSSVAASLNIRSTISGFQIDTGMNLLDVAIDPDNAAENYAQSSQLALGLGVLGGKAFKLLKMLSGKFRKSCNSFMAGTEIWTGDGLREIQGLSIGDNIWAFDVKSQAFRLQEIVHLIQREGAYDLIRIVLENGTTINTTEYHPFYVKTENDWVWTDAREIRDGTILWSKKDGGQTVSHISSQKFAGPVYNLTVSMDHTFLVGGEGVVAHNAGKCSDKLDELHMFDGSRGGGVHHLSGVGKKWKIFETVDRRGDFYKVRLQNKANPAKFKYSTFFPDSMSREQIKAISWAAVYQRNFTKGPVALEKIWPGYPKGIKIFVTEGPNGWHASPRFD